LLWILWKRGLGVGGWGQLGSKNIAGVLTAKPKETYYRDTDLHIGSYIRIFDRDMLIHDVDEFTRNYYQKKYGYTEDMLEAVNVQVLLLFHSNLMFKFLQLVLKKLSV
jgi:protein associated with RNAse G/E